MRPIRTFWNRYPHYRLYILGPLVILLGLGAGAGYLAIVNHFSTPAATGDPLPTVVKIKSQKVIVTKRIHVPGKTKIVHGKTVFVPAHTEVITSTHFVRGPLTTLTGPTHTTTRTVNSTVFHTVTGPTTTTVKTITGPTTTTTTTQITTQTITGPTVTGPTTTISCTVDTNGATIGCS